MKQVTIHSILFLFSLILALSLGAQDQGAGEAGTEGAGSVAPGTEALGNVEEARQALAFGIDATVISVIKQATGTKDRRIEKDVARIFDSPNPDVRVAIWDYFQALSAWDELWARTLDLISMYEQYPDKVVVRALRFVRDSGKEGTASLARDLKDILNFKEQDVQLAALDTLGRVNLPDDIGILRDFFQKPGISDALRVAALGSMGRKKSPALKEFFEDILDDDGESAELRRAALSALGNLADPGTLPRIGRGLTSTDVFERTAAINALAGYDLPQVKDLYFQALRDSAWRNRVLTLDALRERNTGAFNEALYYLAERDPERPVRQAALRTLVAQDDQWSVLNAWLEDPKKGPELKVSIVNLSKDSMEKLVPGLRAIIRLEEKNQHTVILEQIARELSGTRLREPVIYEALLLHPKASVRALAVKGIQFNELSSMNARLEELLKTTTDPAVRNAIQEALKARQ